MNLSRCPLFDGIRHDELDALMGCVGAREVSVRRNEAILREGEPAREIGILLSGRAQVVRTDYYGNRSIVVGIEAGELFGETFACAAVDALPVSVVAAEACSVLLINCQRLMTPCTQACGFHSRLIYNLLRIVASKNLIMHQKEMITSKRTTREKLMTYLLLQAKAAGNDRFSIPFDRQGLADFLGVDRSGLSSELGKLKREGILDYYKSDFRLLHVTQ